MPVMKKKAALKRPHSKRFASDGALDAARQSLECGRFSPDFLGRFIAIRRVAYDWSLLGI